MPNSTPILISFLINTFCFTNLLSQDIELSWAKRLTGSDLQDGFSIVVDTIGNVYTAGRFRGTTDFDPGPGTYNLTATGYEDLYISKLNNSGNFVWAKKFNGLGDEEIYSLEIDNGGNLYTTGVFNQTIDMDPGPDTFNLYPTGPESVFVCKLDNSGAFVWAIQFEAAYGYSIDVDSLYNVYCMGFLFDTADFDPGPGIFNLEPNPWGTYIVKLNSDAEFMWAKQYTGAYSGSATARSLSLDSYGNIYTTGKFSGEVDFDPGPGTYVLSNWECNPQCDDDLFIAKLNSSGEFIWAREMGGDGQDVGVSVVIDTSGNVYTMGFFQETVDFDPGSGSYNLISVSNYTYYISKLNSEGNFIWAKAFGGFNNNVNEYQKREYSLAIDDNANLYTTGFFDGVADFNPGVENYTLNALVGADIFAAAFDKDGNFAWAKKFGNSSTQYGRAITVDDFGNPHLTGYFEGTIDFDPGPGISNLSSNWIDAYIVKLHCEEVEIITNPQSQQVSVCDIAHFTVSCTGTSPFTYKWYKNGILIPDANDSTYTTPNALLGDNNSSYYCIVSNCSGSHIDTSLVAIVTVNPPCKLDLPHILLNKTILSPGEDLSITGSDFTMYGAVSLSIIDESGHELVTSNPSFNPELGEFEYNLSITPAFLNGQYSVTAVDLVTGDRAPTKLFQVNNLIEPGIQIITPNITSVYGQGTLFDVVWTDFVESDGMIGQGGLMSKRYFIEISLNGGNTWSVFWSTSYTEDSPTNEIHTFTFHNYSTHSAGTILLRITDLDDPTDIAISEPFTVYDCSNTGFKGSLEWDPTVPDYIRNTKPHPIGIAADSTARIFIRLKKSASNERLVSTIVGTIVTNEYTTPSLLGKLQYAQNHLSYSIEANNADSISDTYNANTNANADDYWFWLVAPDDFTHDLDDEREYREIDIQFTVTYLDNTTETIVLCDPVYIYRPALALVHGLGGDESTFQYCRYTNNSGGESVFDPSFLWRVSKRINLKEFDSFQTNAEILLSIGADEAYTFENSFFWLIRRMHLLGIANKRVDYVSHSMGGVVGRTAINYGNSWYNPGVQFKNYGNGYINKFITICTPHNGSFLADFGVKELPILLLPFSSGVGLVNASAAFFDNIGFLTKAGNIAPAVINLQSSEGGIPFSTTMVKNHLIASDIDQFDDLGEDLIIESRGSLGLNKLRWLTSQIYGSFHNYFLTKYGTSEFFSETDFIVPLSSQLATKNEIDAIILNQDPLGIGETSILYGIDKYHIGIVEDLIIGNRIKTLLNARLNSGYFSQTIPAKPVIPNNFTNSDIQSRTFSTGDTVINYIDTLNIKIQSPLTNEYFLVDSVEEVVVILKDTIGLQSVSIYIQDKYFESFSRDSIQAFSSAIGPEYVGRNLIIAIARFDSNGIIVNHIDTTSIIVGTLDTILFLDVIPERTNLNPREQFRPDHQLIYPRFISLLSPDDENLVQFIADTNVIYYDSLELSFVAKDTGSTYIVYSYEGFHDTIFIYISETVKDGIIEMCVLDTISLFAGINDSTKLYQWQVDTLEGFANIADNMYYANANSPTLTITAPPSLWYNYRYRCIISDAIGSTVSMAYSLRFKSIWSGAVDSLWHTGGNWSCDTVPTSLTDVLIPSGVMRYPHITENAYCRTLHLKDEAEILVKSPNLLCISGDQRFQCPEDIVIQLCGQDFATVFYDISQPSSCGGIIIQSSGITSGDTFSIGTTTNCFQFIDEYGVIISTCCFDVILLADTLPTIECDDITISCTESINPEDLLDLDTIIVEVSVNPNLPLGPGNGVVTEAQIELTVPFGAIIYDVNVLVDLDHTWSADLDAYLVSPEEITVELATDVCGASDNWANVLFDDEASITVSDACGGNPTLDGPVRPEGNLSDLDGLSVSGIWNLMITDDASGDGGTLNTFGLSVVYTVPIQAYPVVDDDCGIESLTYTDSVIFGDCNTVSGIVTRIWTATDSSGNSSSCEQTITLLSDDPQITCPEDMLIELLPGETEMQVNYTLSTLCFCSDSISQVSGIESGGNFPIGITTNCFNLLSNGIIIDSCCFDVIVNEFEYISCLPEGISFSTQAQIDSFSSNYPGCNQLGSVEINDSYTGNITNLNGLSQIISITGSLNILQNPALTSLNGLNSLTSIGGDLWMRENNSLINLEGLNDVTSVGNSLFIAFNPSLASLNGLNSLNSIGGFLLIEGNNVLANISDINALNTIGTFIKIYNNDELNSLSGLDNIDYNDITNLYIQNCNILSICDVESICNYLNIPSNTATISGNSTGCVSRFEVESECNSCEISNLILTTQSEIDSFTYWYPGCTTVSGELTIQGSNITNLNGLTQIDTIIQGLSIYNNPLLDNLHGLDGLRYVGGSLAIGSNPHLENLIGLDSLSHIGSSVSITGNDSLINLHGLNSITNFNGLNISSNTSLVNLQGLETVTTLNGMGTTITGNPSLQSLSGLDNVTFINFNLNLSENQSLNNVDHLNSLQSINGGLYVSNNDLLSNLIGLDSIIGFNGSLHLIYNPVLSACEAQFICEYLSTSPEIAVIHDNAIGCDNVAQVQVACDIPVTCPGVLILNSQSDINSFPSTYPGCSTVNGLVTVIGTDITNLDSLTQIDTITQGLSIYNNLLLENLHGLDGLRYVGGSLAIGSNPHLENLIGLDSLSHIGSSVSITGNDSLINLQGLNSITNFNGLNISSNTSLVNLQGLETVTTLNGMGTTISGNPSLQSLSGLDNVTFVDFILNLSDNPSLTTLDQLSNLESINGSLLVSSNSLLSNINGLFAMTTINGEISITNNSALTGLNGLDNININTISNLGIVNCQNLSLCDVQSVCDYLSIQSNPANITGNATGCISRSEVESDCTSGFKLIANNVCVTPGSVECIDVKVTDFEDITAMNLSINWDSTKFIFDHVEGLGLPGLAEDNFGIPGDPDVEEGQLTINWLDLTLNGISVYDYSTIFKVCLQAIGQDGTSSEISFSDIPLEIEIATLDSMLEYELFPGLAEISTQDLLIVNDFDCQQNYDFGTGSEQLIIVENPDPDSNNTSENVGLYLDPPYEPWAALCVDFNPSIDLSEYNQLIFQINSPADIPVLVKLEGGTSPAYETWLSTTQSGAWESLQADFSSQIGEDHTRLCLFLNAGVEEASEIPYYLDNLHWE